MDITNEEFRVGQEAPKTRTKIYSAMIILGFLSYYDGYLKIPNKELMREFEKALQDEYFGYLIEIIIRKFVKEHENVLLVTICYDSKMKNHSCKIERGILVKYSGF